MAEFSSWMDNAATNFEGFSRWLTKLFKPGVSTGLAVSQRAAGANMSVDIAVGDVVPMSTNSAAWDWTTAVKNVTIGAVSVTNRRDIVVAYTDTAVTNPSTATPNNPGALKFMVVAGTPAASPSDPSDVTIQAAVGAGKPFEKLARVSLTSSTTQITNAQITDLRRFMALNVQRLWGGASNTLGHLVPNQADGTVYVSSSGKPEASDFTNPYKFSAYMAGIQTTGAGAQATKVILNTEDFDTSNNFDAVTNFRFTAPVAGFYQFDGCVHTAVIGAVRRVIPMLYKNGSEWLLGTEDTQNANYIGASVSGLIQLAAGDYVELWVYTSDGQNFDGTTRKNRLTGFLVSKL